MNKNPLSRSGAGDFYYRLNGAQAFGVASGVSVLLPR